MINELGFSLPAISNWPIHTFWGWVQKGYEIDFSVSLKDFGGDLQRPLVWDENAKNNYINLLRLQCVFTPIVLLAPTKDNPLYRVLDGKQRLTCILEAIENGKIDVDNEFLFMPVCQITQNLTEKQMAKLFLILNPPTIPQNANHLQNLQNFINS